MIMISIEFEQPLNSLATRACLQYLQRAHKTTYTYKGLKYHLYLTATMSLTIHYYHTTHNSR